MKAVVVHQYGGSEVLKFEDYPDPAAGPGEVLVRVAASSVNPIDYKRRAGLTKDFYPIKFPGLIGVDIAGTVIKIGPGVEGFSISAIQDTKRYLQDFDRAQKTATSDQQLFDQMTELYPHWVANQSWLMFGFPQP